MLSRIVIKLINETIIPALLIVAVKLVGISLCLLFLNIPWQTVPGAPIPRLQFATEADYILVSSWSSFFVILAIACGLLWVLIKANFFHDTHITPRLTLRLLDMDLLNFLSTTVEISHQAVVWLSYFWLLLAFAAVQTYLGYFYGWMLTLGVMLGLLLTWLFVADLEKELALDSP